VLRWVVVRRGGVRLCYQNEEYFLHVELLRRLP
jgi:hypothetical protein